MLHLRRVLLPEQVTDNPILYSAWDLWQRLRKEAMLNPHVSLFLPLRGNPDLVDPLLSKATPPLHEAGYTYIGKLVNMSEKIFDYATIQRLVTSFSTLPFQYLQLASYVRSVIARLSEKYFNNDIDNYIVEKTPP